MDADGGPDRTPIDRIVGAALFSGDIALRAFAGHRRFPYAAPSGGMILIAAWLGLIVAAAVGAASRGLASTPLLASITDAVALQRRRQIALLEKHPQAQLLTQVADWFR